MRKDEIKVSIVCITYNQSGYIRDALDSFLSQKTTFEYEILVHDDASDDGTAEIIKEYEEKYPDKITAVLQKENQYSKGVKVATTYLYPIVKGKYVAFCEGDDYWVDDLKLQKQFDYMEKHNECSMCMHNGLNVSKDRKTIFYSKPLSKTARKYTTVDAIKDSRRNIKKRNARVCKNSTYGRLCQSNCKFAIWLYLLYARYHECTQM